MYYHSLLKAGWLVVLTMHIYDYPLNMISCLVETFWELQRCGFVSNGLDQGFKWKNLIILIRIHSYSTINNTNLFVGWNICNDIWRQRWYRSIYRQQQHRNKGSSVWCGLNKRSGWLVRAYEQWRETKTQRSTW